MDPNINNLNEKVDENILYAPDEQALVEHAAVEENIKKATNDVERAQFARLALLEQYKKYGLLSKWGFEMLTNLTSREVLGTGDSYVEEPVMDEESNISYRKK